ncbi:MAG: hypothetical protein AB8H86_25725 [Polyangiales bacterium]
MSLNVNHRQSLALYAFLLAGLCAPHSVTANDWDITSVGTSHASIYFDYRIQTADPGSLRYLARFLRAAERLPDGVRVSTTCYEDTVFIRLDEEMLATANTETRTRLREQVASVRDEEPMRSFSRLRTCLAHAARKVQSAFPGFRPAQESTEWFALTLDDPADFRRASDEGMLYEPGNEFGSGLMHSNGNLANPNQPFGFFLTREDAESASGNLASPQRMHRRGSAELLAAPFY